MALLSVVLSNSINPENANPPLPEELYLKLNQLALLIPELPAEPELPDEPEEPELPLEPEEPAGPAREKLIFKKLLLVKLLEFDNTFATFIAREALPIPAGP